MRKFKVRSDEFKFINVSEKYKVKDFLEVTDKATVKESKEQIAVILERTSDHKLVFLKINLKKQNDSMEIELINLGEDGLHSESNKE